MTEMPSIYPEFGRDVLQPRILPLYRLPYPGHSRQAVPRSIHGVLHICRCLLLGETMMDFYDTILARPSFDRFAVRHAIAFHDAARQDDGVDRWERDSANLATRFISENHPERSIEYAGYVGHLIDKAYISRHLGDDVNAFIVTAADCLDIIRVYPLNRGFRREMLGFLDPDRDVVLKAGRQNNLPSDPWALREGLLQDVSRWIDDTENWRLQQSLEASATPLLDLIHGLGARPDRYPVLARLRSAMQS